jgi:toxin-antitoxin system PIN domain toxin
MRALVDVNVLTALLDADHVSHLAATRWFAQNLKHGWASCPITENATARVMASVGYRNPVPVAEVLRRTRQATNAGYHEFWVDNVRLSDGSVFNHAELLGPKQITDRYLLALAVKNGGRLVTFDQAVRPTAAIGASANHLVQISG